MKAANESILEVKKNWISYEKSRSINVIYVVDVERWSLRVRVQMFVRP